MIAALLLAAGFLAGAMNCVAGGGSFVTLMALLVAGLDPRAANITSSVALFPGQIVTGLAGRGLVSGAGGVSFGLLFILCLVGGAVGAGLLLATPGAVFARLLPFLVLLATGLFAWGSFRQKSRAAGGKAVLGPVGSGLALFGTAVYGGYFGGGLGFLLLAALSLAGQATRAGMATKNMLASVLNASAVAVFVFFPEVSWWRSVLVGIGAIGGGLAGSWLLIVVSERVLRATVVVIGTALTIGLLLRGP